jgi:hypothetical protein
MYINSHLGPCVCTQSPKYLEMAQGHISLSVPLSTVIAFGAPKRQTMFYQKNFCTVANVIVAKGFASIHLEKYHTATTTYFRLPCAGGNGPNKSSPHLCNGHVGFISWVKDEGCFSSLTHLWQFFTFMI